MDGKYIVIYDGVCNLCNFTVRFLIKLDHKHRLHFAHLQSNTSTNILEKNNIDSGNINSVAFAAEGRVFLKSEAIFEILRVIGFPWNIFLFLKVFPIKFLDNVYDIVAANRYKWFGKNDYCLIPTAQLQKRFID